MSKKSKVSINLVGANTVSAPSKRRKMASKAKSRRGGKVGFGKARATSRSTR